MRKGHGRRVQMIDFDKENIRALRNGVCIISKTMKKGRQDLRRGEL